MMTSIPPRPSNPRLEASRNAFHRAMAPECRAAGRCVCQGCTPRAFEAAVEAIRAFDVRRQMRESVRAMKLAVVAVARAR